MTQNTQQPKSQNCVIYARFSSKNQKEQSIDIQVKACEDYANQKSYKIVDRYCDYAKSGRNSNRKELQRMIGDSATRAFSIVLVHKMDRWFRNQRESLNCLQALHQNNVTLISVTEGGTGTPNDKLLTGVFGVFAEFESDKIAERIKGGQKETSMKGLFLGGNPPLGYSIDRNTRKYVRDDEEAIIVEKIFNMYADGTGYSEILRYLNSMDYRTKKGNAFGTNSLHDLLKNEKYTGRYIYGVREDKIINGKRHIVKRPPKAWTIIEDAIPQIIDRELFERVQTRLAGNKIAAGRYKAKEVYLLSGLIRCGICGSPMHANTRPDGYSSYDCGRKNSTTVCWNRGIRRETLDNYVIDKLYNELFSSTSVKELSKLINEHNEEMSSDAIREIDLARRRLEEVKMKISKTLDLVGNSGISMRTVEEKIEEWEQDKRYATRYLKKMKRQYAIDPIPESMVLDLLVESKKLLKAHNNDYGAERRNFMRSYVKKITVSDDMVKIIYNIN